MAKDKDKEREQAIQKGEVAIKKLGLMHGVPISVKDTIYQKGKLSTFGLAYLCDESAL
jgi:Asp-tRNA(Asn)/Glu-tRNA(Gln) amidotransferase A subunit family amidase